MELIVEQKHRVLHVTLNRPEKRNALTVGMCTQLVEAIRFAGEHRNVGAVLLCATGHVFCSGIDLDEAATIKSEELSAIHEQLFTVGLSASKPMVISVNGAALGAGLGLVAQGHVVIAADGAAFALPEIRIGLWPFLVYRSVEAAIGPRRTLELSLTGRPFQTGDALLWGLIHQACHVTELGERAKGIARELAKASPTAIGVGLEYFHQARGRTWTEAGELARRLRGEIMGSADFQEGYEAFKQKRNPRWPSMPPKPEANK